MFKRLMHTTGEIASVGPMPGDTPARITRTAIFVHGGPNGVMAQHGSEDGDLQFDDTRIKAVVERYNAELSALAEEHGGYEKLPAGAMMPILDQHGDDSSVARVLGRACSYLRYENRDVPKVGKNVPCAVGEITFLGEENVQRVLDGRIYNLSVCIGDNPDAPETYNMLSELSSVIDPAAPGASLLKKGGGKAAAKGATMGKKMQAKMKSALGELKRMSAQTADLKKAVGANQAMAKLAARKSAVHKRLSALTQAGKLTPAELRSMNIDEIAAMPQAAGDMMLKQFDALQPRVTPGQVGSTNAINFSQLATEAKDADRAKMRAEIRGDFKKLGIKMRGDNKSTAADAAAKGDKKRLKTGAADPAPKADAAKAAAPEVADKASASADADDGVDIPTVESQDQIAEISNRVDELSTNLARVVAMVTDLMSDDEEGDDGDDGDGDDDSADMAAEGDGGTDMAADDDDDDSADAASDDDKSDDKKAGADDAKSDDKKEMADKPAEDKKPAVGDDADAKKKKAKAKMSKKPGAAAKASPKQNPKE